MTWREILKDHRKVMLIHIHAGCKIVQFIAPFFLVIEYITSVIIYMRHKITLFLFPQSLVIEYILNSTGRSITKNYYCTVI